MKLHTNVFNDAFRFAMSATQLKNLELCETSGKSQAWLSNLRNGKGNPGIQDFMELVMLCEQLRPGFFEIFTRKLIGESRRLTVSPEELVNSLDSSELGALMHAVGNRMCDASNRNQDKDLIAS
jgi:transcriptional regulator with XRE-family HTH domain